MRIKKINHVNEFLQAIEKCKHDVWLTSPYGDKYNSLLKQDYIQ